MYFYYTRVISWFFFIIICHFLKHFLLFKLFNNIYIYIRNIMCCYFLIIIIWQVITFWFYYRTKKSLFYNTKPLSMHDQIDVNQCFTHIIRCPIQYFGIISSTKWTIVVLNSYMAHWPCSTIGHSQLSISKRYFTHFYIFYKFH